MAIQKSHVYRGIPCPNAYFRVVGHQDVDQKYLVITYHVYYNEATRRGDIHNYLEPALQRVVQDTPAILNSDGSVQVPATTYYTDLFSDAALQAAGNSPLRACYKYLKATVLTGGVDV